MAIPKEQYLGVYFKSSDQDLIEWKKQSREDNLTLFVKAAIREKIDREKCHKKLEHPTIFLRRMESQQTRIATMIQNILVAINRINADVRLQEHSQGEDEIVASSLNELDDHCVDAGWK